MRTTIRLDDELLERLEGDAKRQNVSLTRIIDDAIRAYLAADADRRPRTAYREQVHAMGVARRPLDKALSLASALEDDEIARMPRSR
jgi:predicted transcriptional regulator